VAALDAVLGVVAGLLGSCLHLGQRVGLGLLLLGLVLGGLFGVRLGIALRLFVLLVGGLGRDRLERQAGDLLRLVLLDILLRGVGLGLGRFADDPRKRQPVRLLLVILGGGRTGP